VERDLRIRRCLRRLGFSVWRMWEHELRPTRLARTMARIRRAVQLARDK
jgi:G:T-mismatch repair DNA endonuclease (very short patch repair protein)